MCWSMLDHSRTRLCSMHLWESSQNSHKQQCRFGHGTKNSKGEVVRAGEKDLDDQKRLKRQSREFAKYLAKPKEIVMRNKSRNPDSTKNSLVHHEETH